jgi:hypothetical protein
MILYVLLFLTFVVILYNFVIYSSLKDSNVQKLQNKNIQKLTAKQAREIAKEAYIYGFPLVDSYRIQYTFFVDKDNKEFKAPWNTLKNIPRIFTPEDTIVQSPNSDTPYSVVGMDLRAEPIVITVPLISNNRYFSIMLIDAYTFNFDYIGTRTTGNGGGNFLVAGPNWNGKIPSNINKSFVSETELALAIFRTQLFDKEDLQNVINIQSQYKAQTLSSFLGNSNQPQVPKIDFIKPLTPDTVKTSLEFFNILNFVLGFCKIHSSEANLMKKFSKIDVGPGLKFDPSNFSPEILEAIKAGMVDAWDEFNGLIKLINENKVKSSDMFGSREALKNNYLYRMAGAVIAIYCNSKEEAIYPMYFTDSNGVQLNGQNKYTMHFDTGLYPPAKAFWSLTMYNLPDKLLVANPINRYLINSPMLPNLSKDKNGGLTIYIQHSPPTDPIKLKNWLPSPKDSFFVVLRLYWPKNQALNNEWNPPPVIKQ